MHTLLDYDGKLPVYVNITEGSVGDNKGACDIPLENGAVIVADRYYNDFPLLNVWDSKGVFFVIWQTDNRAFHTVKERELPKVKAQQVLIDEEIELSNPLSKAKYPGKIRRVVVWNEEKRAKHSVDYQQPNLDCKNHRGSLQIPVGDRSVFPRHQTVVPHQNGYRYLKKCGNYLGLDYIDHHPIVESHESHRKIRMASIQSCRLYPIKPIRQK